MQSFVSYFLFILFPYFKWAAFLLPHMIFLVVMVPASCNVGILLHPKQNFRPKQTSKYAQKSATKSEEEEEEFDKTPDPLHQLILHFSRTALTERRYSKDFILLL